MSFFSDNILTPFFLLIDVSNQTRLLGVVKQLNLKKQLILASDILTSVWILLLHALHIYNAFIYVLCNCCFIVLGYFGPCSRIKLRLRNHAYEMQLSFLVYGLWNRHPLFTCSKTIFIKLWESEIKIYLFFSNY